MAFRQHLASLVPQPIITAETQFTSETRKGFLVSFHQVDEYPPDRFPSRSSAVDLCETAARSPVRVRSTSCAEPRPCAPAPAADSFRKIRWRAARNVHAVLAHLHPIWWKSTEPPRTPHHRTGSWAQFSCYNN